MTDFIDGVWVGAFIGFSAGIVVVLLSVWLVAMEHNAQAQFSTHHKDQLRFASPGDSKPADR